MAISESDVGFLEEHHCAATITAPADGVAKVSGVAVALVDGMHRGYGLH